MKKYISTRYSAGAFNFGILVMRVVLGLILVNHGYSKLVKFSTLKVHFMNFMNIGSTTSLTLIIFAEFFCGILLILGMFTRLAAIPVVIGMGVAFIIAEEAHLFGKGELPGMLVAAAIAILCVGPGRISVDGMMTK